MSKEIIDIKKIRTKSNVFKKETGDKISFYILSGLGVVAALSWNETIQSLINLIPIQRNGIIAKVIYSIIITIFLVIMTIVFNKMKENGENKINKNK